MSSKSYTIDGSKYGAVDENVRAIGMSSEPSAKYSSTQEPPKPAVRHRLPQAKNTTKDDNSDNVNDQDSTNNTMALTRIDPEINSSKGALTLPLPTSPQQPSRPYPKKVLFIVANEFCERFSYYGLKTILVLYFRSVLGLSDSTSTVSYHLFATLCFLTPILGAILGDTVWGKYKTILYLSIVYLLGEVTLVASSVFWYDGTLSAMATFFGLFLIGVGTGGIKPCVSALGGDQFLSHEEKWRQNFFSLFYGAINLGSLISMFLTPMLRSNYSCVNRSDCYPYAFGLPTILMFLSIVIFLVAKNHYVLVPLPEKNVIVAFCQCTFLALKRKLMGYKLPVNTIAKDEHNQSDSSTSSSTLSISDNDDNLVKKQATDISLKNDDDRSKLKPINSDQDDQNHWLFLASDRFDTKSIKDFRSVWNIMLIFAPTPVYWCLFDQQGSLWTLQATRMDGNVFNTGFILQPDQMSVANPLLLLASIPVFQVFIYPCLSRCNLLTKPIQRMTTGGLLAALTFVLSALIELRIQQFMPMEQPLVGKANLLIVNGLSDCYMSSPMISHVQIPGIDFMNEISNNNTTVDNLKASQRLMDSVAQLNDLEPLGSSHMDLISAKQHRLNNYKLKFKLSNGIRLQPSAFNSSTIATPATQCPLNPQVDHEFSIGPLPDQSMRLLYLQQGNGKLTYKLFNNSLALPPAGQARVQLLYESFGSFAQAEKRTFYLARAGQVLNNSTTQLKFQTSIRDGQIFLSKYLDIPVGSRGDIFILRSSDNLIGPNSQQSFLLEQGTRNLIVVHQLDSISVKINHQVLQDNNYRISLLYQLGPYLLISVSEVMFSITGLEFSYSVAPSNMKSVILGAWSLMTAFGNIITVAVESARPFSNLAHDFLFYAAIMAVDMFVFAFIGLNYKPYRGQAD